MGDDLVEAPALLLNRARQAIENATGDKAARRVRTSEEAQRQQAAIRRIGRILSMVKVDADADAADEEAIVDAELVDD